MTTTPIAVRTTRSPGKQRVAARSFHLAAAALLGTFVYAPADFAEPLRMLLQFVLVPGATLTGLFLWKQAAIRRLLTRRGRARAAFADLSR